MIAGNDAAGLPHNTFDFVRQRAAVGVAQHDPPRPRLMSRARTVQGIVRIGLVSVEKMLAVDHRLAARLDRGLHACLDALEIFLERAAERDMDMIVPGLGDEHDGVGVRGEQACDAGVVLGRSAGAFGHTEGRKARPHRRLALEEFRVDRIGAGIAPFDIVDPQTIEQGCDLALVLERKVDACRLRAVAQRGIKEVEAFARHFGRAASGVWLSGARRISSRPAV